MFDEIISAKESLEKKIETIIHDFEFEHSVKIKSVEYEALKNIHFVEDETEVKEKIVFPKVKIFIHNPFKEEKE